MQTLGLYLHIPFCKGKCPYCDFYSVAAQEEQMDAYTEKLCALLRAGGWEEPVQADTLYLGGGTPVLLGEKRLSRILETAAAAYHIPKEGEITLEANPSAVTLPLLQSLSESGFNRISLGLQSANDAELSFLGRRHSAAQAARAVGWAQQAGFRDISLDLMLGLAGQTEQSLERSVAFCAETGAEHVSAYLLKIEENTPFFRQNAGDLCPDEEEQANLYLAAVSLLEERGYHQYEISNFAKNGRVGQHNLKYWHCQEYIGIGPAAHSYWKGQRLKSPRDLKGFLHTPSLQEFWIADGPGGTAEEVGMLALRLTEGLDLSAFYQRFPDFSAQQGERLEKKAKELALHGLLTFDGRNIALTPQGFLLSNAIIGELLL